MRVKPTSVESTTNRKKEETEDCLADAQTEEEERKEIRDESGSEIENDRWRDDEKRKTLEREKERKTLFKPHKRN